MPGTTPKLWTFRQWLDAKLDFLTRHKAIKPLTLRRWREGSEFSMSTLSVIDREYDITWERAEYQKRRRADDALKPKPVKKPKESPKAGRKVYSPGSYVNSYPVEKPKPPPPFKERPLTHADMFGWGSPP